ncbi:uncharacterized protein LOC126847570 [Adelges cooleyi]|uniref:uncharacterized protein LOC126847570 n=1 Tax=Adelges cooleyi TaxID=133065 RepID=UPI002180634E|nr:uncharacterized protein LOC126847570 [Adelges cooleyi]
MLGIMKPWAALLISILVVARCIAAMEIKDNGRGLLKSYRAAINSTNRQTDNKQVQLTYAQPYVNAVEYSTSRPERIRRRTTEQPQDTIRVFVTPLSARINNHNEEPTTTQNSQRSQSTGMYFVTAKTPVYSTTPTGYNAKELSLQEKSRQTDFNGTRRLMKNHRVSQQPQFLYATTLMPGANSSTLVHPAGNSMSLANSKPFTMVMVPKQKLNELSDSFKPMPLDSPQYTNKQQALDINSINENRRMAAVSIQASQLGAIVSHGVQKQPVGYKAPQAEQSYNGEESSSEVKSHESAIINKRDRFNSPVYGQPVQKVVELEYKPKRDDSLNLEKKQETARYQEYKLPKRESLNQESFRYHDYKTHKPDESLNFKTTQETNRHQNPFLKDASSKSDQVVRYEPQPAAAPRYTTERLRVFYPVTEESPAKQSQYSPYKTPEPQSLDFMSPVVESSRPPMYLGEQSADNEYSNVPSRYEPKPSGDTETKGFPAEDTKGVLKLILEDILKPKQQNEIKQKRNGMDEIIEYYAKTKRPTIDSFDEYDIDTDMNCNLRSTRHITDGQCTTTRPIVEAVCADRCLVYASTLPFNKRVRPSYLTKTQQVEALHCVNGDTKMLRVQLQCQDGAMLNNIIKVVTSCRCKLHQIQPQMRNTKTPSTHSLGSSPMQEIMNSEQF